MARVGPRWWRYLRTAANQRAEVECRTCGNLYWMTWREARWSVCPHCAGHWTWPDDVDNSDAT